MPTKILIVIPVPSSYLFGLLRATKYIGIETKVFNSRGYTFLEKISIFFQNKTFATKLLNWRLVKTAKEFKPNALLVIKGELISKETLNQMRDFGIKTVNWFPDYINAFELALKLSQYYNYFFHFDPLAASRLNVHYLPFAADILPSDPLPTLSNYNYAVSFVGNYYPIREEYLKKVSDLGLNIWGDKRWAKSSLAHCYQGDQLPNSKFAEVSRHSKINLNIQHEYPCDGVVLRPFEVLGAGAFLLTENKRDVRKLFKNNVVSFNSPEDLRKKVIYFLANDKEREK